MDFLEKCRKKRIRKIAKLKIKSGWFVNFTDEYADVWHQVDQVFDESCTVFKSVCAAKCDQPTYDNSVKTDYTSFGLLDNAVRVLPKNAR